MQTSSFGPAFLQRETGKSGQDIKEKGKKDGKTKEKKGREGEKRKKIKNTQRH